MNDSSQRVPLWRVVQSVLAAMFGVQSSRNRERDFTKGRPAAYIIVGLLFTVVFVLVLLGVVSLIMWAATR